MPLREGVWCSKDGRYRRLLSPSRAGWGKYNPDGQGNPMLRDGDL